MSKKLQLRNDYKELLNLTDDIATCHRRIEAFKDIVTDDSLKAALIHEHNLIGKAGYPELKDVEAKLDHILKRLDDVDKRIAETNTRIVINDLKNQKMFYNLEAKCFNRQNQLEAFKPLARLRIVDEDLEAAIPTEAILSLKVVEFMYSCSEAEVDRIQSFYGSDFQFSANNLVKDDKICEVLAFFRK